MAETESSSANPTAVSWFPLLPDEALCWEGRPAPRCYTFRHWRHALFGLLLTLFCAAWLWMGMAQAAATGWPWLSWVPLPFLGYALWLAAGQLLAARLEWNNVAYAITDLRLIVRRGVLRPCVETLPLERVTWFRMKPLGEELGNLRVHGETGDPVLLLYCIEYPRRPAELLEKAIKAKQQPQNS